MAKDSIILMILSIIIVRVIFSLVGLDDYFYQNGLRAGEKTRNFLENIIKGEKHE